MGRRLDPELRRELLRRAAGRCEICGKALVWHSTHVHHLTYERLGCERPDDLLVLCLRCHERQHPGMKFRSLLEQERRRQRKGKNRKRGRRHRGGGASVVKARGRRTAPEKARRRGETRAQHQARRSLENAKRRFERRPQRSFEDIARGVRGRLEKERRRSAALRWLGVQRPDRDGRKRP